MSTQSYLILLLSMLTTKDTYNEIKSKNVLRVVSLVPSLSEFIYDQAPEKLVGVTKFCIQPKGMKNERTVVGGTKTINIDTIRALKPDLIVANKEENQKEQVEALSDLPDYLTDMSTLQESFAELRIVAELLGTNYNWDEAYYSSPKPPQGKSVLYVIWNNPIMSIGQDTFIHDMLSFLGFKNVMRDYNRYPEVSDEMVKEIAPDYVFLSSEPFPFKEKHIYQFQEMFPNSKIVLVNGEAFSWYGSRMFKVSSYLEDLLKGL